MSKKRGSLKYPADLLEGVQISRGYKIPAGMMLGLIAVFFLVSFAGLLW